MSPYPDWLLTWGRVDTWAGAILGTLFVVVYWVRSPWWRTRGGRFVMELEIALALVLDLGLLGDLFGMRLWFAVIYVAAFTAVPVTLARRIVLLIRVQVLARKDLEEEER